MILYFISNPTYYFVMYGITFIVLLLLVKYKHKWLGEFGEMTKENPGMILIISTLWPIIVPGVIVFGLFELSNRLLKRFV